MASTSKIDEFWIVGIGASAGGLEALSSFVRELPPNAPAAFVIAQHLAPHSKSMMVELLSRQTVLPIVAVKDRSIIKPGTICIIPPNFDATFEEGRIKLTRAGEETRPKPSVDVLFKSMAKAWKKRAVGIILSGTGSDGSEGVRAIKENGGVILAQDNESAKYDGMPRATQDTGMVDEILPAEELGRRLFEILAQFEVQPKPEPVTASDDLKNILQFLKVHNGTDFSQYKMSTISRRVEKRYSALEVPNLKEYLQRLKSDPKEAAALAQEMLVSVTSFFRDPEAYEALTPILEKILEQKNFPDSELRMWIAGCATGEEAYSLAILSLELCRNLNVTPQIKIFATDLDQEALSQARMGLYLPNELKGLSDQQIETYFDRRERFFEAKKSLREMIVFARQNLIQNPPFVRLDLVSCRNVMIYFDSALQQKVFEIFQYSLKPGGFLFLGKSENAPTSMFDTIDRKFKIFRRMNPVAPFVPSISKNHPPIHRDIARTLAKKSNEISPGLTELLPTELLTAYRICGLVVDEHGVIFHIIGDLSQYLKLPTGSADFRFTNLISKSAATEFSVLLRKSKKDKKAYRSRIYRRMTGEKSKKGFTFRVQYMASSESFTKELYLVSLEPRRLTELTTQTSHMSPTDISGRMLELEHELASTKEHLQTVVEELEVSNEELQSLNEELSSTNEELQASNEELETTNEELQSTNEELMTVNEELNTKSAELKLTNVSLENIQNSIGSPLMVVDSSQRLLSYNKDATKIFTFTGSDLGRSITNASCQCEIEDFEEKLQHTIRTGEVSHAVCQVAKSIYQLRMHPNRDENGRIVGAVIIFINNTEFIRAQERLKASDSSIRAIIDGSPALISLKDALGKYLVVNRAFRERYHLSDQEVVGKTDRDLFSEENANLIRDNDLEVLLKQSTAEHEELIEFQNRKYIYLSSRFPVKGPNDASPQIVGTVSLDITAQIQAQHELRVSESRYRAIVEDQAVFVCRHLPNGRLTFTNTAFCNFLGGTPESNSNRTFQSFLTRQEEGKVNREIEKLSPEHPITQYESRVSANSTLPPNRNHGKWIRWIHRGVFDENGKPLEFQAVGFDVTDLHNQTDYLLQKENLFTHVLEHTSDYLTVYKVDGNDFVLESFNQSAAKNRNYGHARLVGKHLSELTDSANAAYILERYEECLREESVITFEEEIDSPGGSRHLLTTLVPIRNEDQKVDRIAALSRDITHLKRVEQALRKQKIHSDAANQAKSDFLAAMSHELRTPLSVITGMSQLLNRAQLTPQQQKYVGSIQQSSKTLLALIEDVLDLSKIEAGKLTLNPQNFSVPTILGDIPQAFEASAQQKGLKLECDFQTGEIPIVTGDALRFKQVLVNLVGNAIKFTQTGSVQIKAEASPLKNKLHWRVRVEVKDSGIGIPEESFHRIFSRFSQADSGISRKFGGTGLGLSISKQLVELMHGKIGFESKVGEGSTFWFVVDFPSAIKATVVNPETKTDLSRLKKLSVLVVEDNTESLQMLVEHLKPEVGTLYAASSAREGIQLFENHSIDVLLFDIQMPEMDGLEATRVIRSLPEPKNKVPIIALTANAMAGDRERFLAAGMNDYLSKPVDFSALFSKLSQWSLGEDHHA